VITLATKVTHNHWPN